jgi:hypothetical protein
MDTICLNDVKSLIQKDGGAHVSIFMPTHHAGGENPQDPIRLKNLMKQAEEKLVAKGLRTAEARAMLSPVERLYTDNQLWRQQSDGLALFIDSSSFFYYRLPLNINEEVGVGDRFYIKPLVPLISDCGWFYVLSLSRHENRLLQCTASGSIRINLEDVPKNMPEALFYVTPDNRMQYHITSQVGGSNFGASSAIQAGEKSRPNYDKRNVLKYFEQVNRGITKYLGEERAPMVLSAVDYLHHLYQKANKYQHLLAEGILGNPDGVSDDTLREQAWTIVKPYFESLQRDAIAEFSKSAGTGRTASGTADILAAAAEGRVRFLFVAEGVQQWGTDNREEDRVTVHDKSSPGDDDLMDRAVNLVLGHAGSVFVMHREEIPGGAPLAAVLRF